MQKALIPVRPNRYPVRIDTFTRECTKEYPIHNVTGTFLREVGFRFEVFFADRPSERTYRDTTFLEFYVKHEDCTQWMWDAFGNEADPDHAFTRELLDDLLADLPRQLRILFPRQPDPYAYPKAFKPLPHLVSASLAN